jgi:hypothetical protein
MGGYLISMCVLVIFFNHVCGESKADCKKSNSNILDYTEDCDKYLSITEYATGKWKQHKVESHTHEESVPTSVDSEGPITISPTATIELETTENLGDEPKAL